MSEEVALRYFFVLFQFVPTPSPAPSGRGKGASNHPPYLALRLCVRCPPVPTKASLSEQAGAHIHPRMGGGMKSGQGDYPSCVPRPAVGGIAGGCMSEEVALRYFFVLFQFVPTLSLVPSGRGKGACYGGVAPLRGPFPNPRITPPYLALRLCVRCPPVPTKASLSEQAGAHIHPRMGGRHEVTTRVSPFVRPPSRRRRDCRGAGTT